MVSLSNHRWLEGTSFDKLRMSGCQRTELLGKGPDGKWGRVVVRNPGIDPGSIAQRQPNKIRGAQGDFLSAPALSTVTSGGAGGDRTLYLPDSIGALPSQEPDKPSRCSRYFRLFQDLIWDSRRLAADSVSWHSWYTNSQGRPFLVDLFAPALCWESRLSTSAVLPT